MSICIYCGQDHVAGLRTCPKTGKTLGQSAQVSQKTLFGVAPPPLRSASLAAENRKLTPLAVSLPPPRPSANPAPGLAKTMVAVAPPKPAKDVAFPSQPPRLPTEQEVRDNPNLVISLDLTPPAGFPMKPMPKARNDQPLVDLAPAILVPDPLPASPRLPEPAVAEAPVDLPPVAMGRKFLLPQPDDETVRRTPRENSRMIRDAKSVFGLVAWATDNYLRNLKPFFLLALVFVLPASIVESCLVAATLPNVNSALLAKTSGTVDFSARRAELAARIQQSQVRGQIDLKASAELAALTSVETAHLPLAAPANHEASGWFRARLVGLIRGLLLFGLTLPIALAALALATIDQEASIALPGLGDLGPIFLARAELFGVTLLPVALVVALGHALFVLPGLALGLLFIFLPHVVLFEKRTGRAALERSVELIKTDARRTVLAVLLFGLVGAAAAMLAELLFPPTGSRAVVFVHFLFSDFLAAVVLPIPAMVLAKLFLDIRSRTGTVAERLSRAARS